MIGASLYKTHLSAWSGCKALNVLKTSRKLSIYRALPLYSFALQPCDDISTTL